jgi:O-antigen ligase
MRFHAHLDRAIDVGLIFVLIFTPLAFGAVEEWAVAVAQLAIMLVCAAWILKITWGPAPLQKERSSILGGRLRLSGLELPAILFAAVVAAQLVPLPASWIQLISPRTAEIYAEALPGFGGAEDSSFTELPAWLQEDPDAKAGDVPALPPDPQATSQAQPQEMFDVRLPAWRTISLTPAHTWRSLQIYLAHLAVFIVLFNQLVDRRRLQRFLFVLAGLVGFLAVEGILQDLTAPGKLYWWRSASSGYSFGPFVSHNSFAGWMEMALPVCAGLAVMLWERQRREGNLSVSLLEQVGRMYAAVVVLSFTAIIGLVAFVIAKSRGGFLAISGAIAMFFIARLLAGHFRLRTVSVALVAALSVAALTAWIGGQQVWERYTTLSEMEKEPSIVSRISTSKKTLEMAADFPVLGSGLGTFEEAYFLYTPGTSYKIFRRAHNDYAQVAAECGLLGLLAVGWALWILIGKGLVPGIARVGSARRWVVQGAAVGLLALLLHSFVDFNLHIYSNSILFIFLCAILLRDRSSVLQRSGPESA